MKSWECVYRAKELLEIAQKMGYTDAQLLFWDYENPEIPFNSLEEMFEETDEDELNFKVGLSLHAGYHKAAYTECVHGEKSVLFPLEK